MLEDRGRHRLGLTGEPGILAAHDPLQRGQLDHHLRRQVALAQAGGARRWSPARPRLSPSIWPTCGDELLDPVHLVEHRAELLLEGQRGQPRGEGLQRVRRVRLEEVGGIGIARPDHALVAGRTTSMYSAPPLRTVMKYGQQLAVGIDHREVALVLLHHRDQHLLGQPQVLLLEVAAQRGRLLHQVGHLVQQAGSSGDRPADLGRQRRDLRRDRGLPRARDPR